MPDWKDLLKSVSGANISSSCSDLNSGYWQVEVEEKSRPFTTFMTPQWLYEFKGMPVGLRISCHLYALHA